jgi:aquaporin Z
MNRYLAEMIGTFFLVLTIGLVVTAGAAGGPLGPIAIGSVLMVMVYAGGHVSGAHYNPAVTLAVFMRGKLKSGDVVPYMLAQVAGAVLASVVVWGVRGVTFGPAPADTASPWAALAIEVLFTFALALVVLNVATTRATQGNSFYGLAIGFTVTAGAVAGGPISGGAFNPAVGVGPLLVHALHGGAWGHIWLYIVGPFAGAALAAAAFRVQHAGVEDFGDVVARVPEGKAGEAGP